MTDQHQPEVPDMVEVWPGLSVGGAPASGIFDGLTEDEKLGAVVGHHRGGNFIVHLNLYDAFEKKPLPKASWWRWLIARDWLPSTWSYQANYWGAFEASSCGTRASAVVAAKHAIDEMIARRAARQ